ncbi:hypothetical protein [Burkholderia ubonensis]|uniref:Uncharacterized protein n=1 Tax=Burkholderia ubonensis subsp. mesacidophila TaxID=265293 RepID=A0A2A4FI58_9BURK|nr:hypothetical protein [Burkholderia ubonensis]PCE32372.1 hypothetical protein BZL54_10960 [Burkholderia ubonensis subsp. mesacidophila]
MGTGESHRVFATQRGVDDIVSDISSQMRAVTLGNPGGGAGQDLAESAGMPLIFRSEYLICYAKG